MAHYSNNKDIAKVVRTFVRSGWHYTMGGRHGRLIAPSGRWLTVPCSPSDYRAVLNFKHEARRLAQKIPSELLVCVWTQKTNPLFRA